MRILVIDDEAQIRKLLQLSLEAEGHEVLFAKSGREGIEKALSVKPEAVLLDLGLPDLGGLEVLSELRRHSQVPILILTVASEEETKVEALDRGADDYLTKPFSTAELGARLRAVSRRRGDGLLAQAPNFERGRLKVDFESRRVWIEGVEAHLTKTELSLLEVLVASQGRVLTHKALLEKVWGHQAGAQIHYLRVYMNNLRRKIEADPARPEFIRTEAGVGYRFVV